MGWIRNYQARNFMRDQMVKGDLAFFYHSNCAEPAVVGMMEIVGKAYPDHTSLIHKKNISIQTAHLTIHVG
ncbi:MAG: hypothetical protein CM1200mP41_24230 [Gammaproteobacteria bacterium]|nr:MAG: hypothetical protein CM1200mP41_24230 [Gammaproteobacteria bacterium]